MLRLGFELAAEIFLPEEAIKNENHNPVCGDLSADERR